MESNTVNWWEDRKSYALYSGYIRSSDAPDYSNFFPVIGGRSSCFKIAAHLIELFETGVQYLNLSSLQLVNIELREKNSLFDQPSIPLCPNPLTTGEDQVPDKFRSLCILMDSNKSIEIWFVARIHLTEVGFTWRLDWTFREKTLSKAIRRSASFVAGVLSSTDPNSSEDVSDYAETVARQYWPTILHMWSEALSKVEKETQTGIHQVKGVTPRKVRSTRRD